MPDSPPPLRGYKYNSHLSLRCFAFSQCPVCKMCQNHNKHIARCNLCESRKIDPAYRTCSCSTMQKEIVKTLEERLRSPLFSVDGMEVPEIRQDLASSPDYQDLNNRLRDEFLGVGVNTAEHTIKDEGTVAQSLKL